MSENTGCPENYDFCEHWYYLQYNIKFIFIDILDEFVAMSSSSKTNRRGFLALVTSIVAGAGCYQVQHDDGTGMLPVGGGGSDDEEPIDLDAMSLLEIAAGETYSIAAGESVTYDGVMFGEESQLEFGDGAKFNFGA